MLKTIAIGNLGRDAAIKEFQGELVAFFSVGETVKVKGENQTTWIDCAWWKPNPTIVRYLKSGVRVFIEGRPKADIFNDKHGAVKPILKLRLNHCEIVRFSDEPMPATNGYHNDHTTNGHTVNGHGHSLNGYNDLPDPPDEIF